MYHPYAISPARTVQSLAPTPDAHSIDWLILRVPGTPPSPYHSLSLPAVISPFSGWMHLAPHIMPRFPIFVPIHPQQVQLSPPQLQPQQATYTARDVHKRLQRHAMYGQQKRQRFRQYRPYPAAGDHDDSPRMPDVKRRGVRISASQCSSPASTTPTYDTTSPSHMQTSLALASPCSPNSSLLTPDVAAAECTTIPTTTGTIADTTAAPLTPPRHDCPVDGLEDEMARDLIKLYQLLHAEAGESTKVEGE
jgi:hypothetical protein